MKRILLLIFFAMVYACSFAQLTGPTNLTTATGNFAQYLSKTQLKATQDMADKAAAGYTFNNRENTKGTRYLFDDWVTGNTFTSINGTAEDVSHYLFNFDKQSGNLLATENKKNVLSVSSQYIKSFILTSGNHEFLFEHLALIDSSKYFIALAKNNLKYSLYKQPSVHFIPSNYRNDGMIETGTKDDEYKDESKYFIVMPDNTFRLLVLKRNALKNILIGQEEKADKYLKTHSEEEINEHFLIGLIDYVNG